MDSDYPFGISKLFLKWSKTKSKYDTLYDKEKQNEHIFYILYLYDKGIDVASFCHFDIWFLNCFDSVVYFVFHLLYKKLQTLIKMADYVWQRLNYDERNAVTFVSVIGQVS
jgi:hypothetical protein